MKTIKKHKKTNKESCRLAKKKKIRTKERLEKMDKFGIINIDGALF